MNILYIHGLNGSLSREKQSILERYGKVHAPSMDYENNPDSIKWLHERCKNMQLDVIIGSSMGGFAGYHLSKLMLRPALVFNPALAYRSVFQHTPDTPDTSSCIMSIILGAKDSIVDPKSTLKYLGDLLIQPQDYTISIRHDLEHRIPVSVFEKEVFSFFERLSLRSIVKKRLFLDDVRSIDMVYNKTFESEFDIVRSYEAFVAYINQHGLPDFISFDNDLGLDGNGNLAPDGLAAAKWLVYESGLDLRHLNYHVHSANPVAAEQIRGLLGNYIKFLNKS